MLDLAVVLRLVRVGAYVVVDDYAGENATRAALAPCRTESLTVSRADATVTVHKRPIWPIGLLAPRGAL